MSAHRESFFRAPVVDPVGIGENEIAKFLGFINNAGYAICRGVRKAMDTRFTGIRDKLEAARRDLFVRFAAQLPRVLIPRESETAIGESMYRQFDYHNLAITFVLHMKVFVTKVTQGGVYVVDTAKLKTAYDGLSAQYKDTASPSGLSLRGSDVESAARIVFRLALADLYLEHGSLLPAAVKALRRKDVMEIPEVADRPETELPTFSSDSPPFEWSDEVRTVAATTHRKRYWHHAASDAEAGEGDGADDEEERDGPHGRAPGYLSDAPVSASRPAYRRPRPAPREPAAEADAPAAAPPTSLPPRTASRPAFSARRLKEVMVPGKLTLRHEDPVTGEPTVTNDAASTVMSSLAIMEALHTIPSNGTVEGYLQWARPISAAEKGGGRTFPEHVRAQGRYVTGAIVNKKNRLSIALLRGLYIANADINLHDKPADITRKISTRAADTPDLVSIARFVTSAIDPAKPDPARDLADFYYGVSTCIAYDVYPSVDLQVISMISTELKRRLKKMQDRARAAMRKTTTKYPSATGEAWEVVDEEEHEHSMEPGMDDPGKGEAHERGAMIELGGVPEDPDVGAENPGDTMEFMQLLYEGSQPMHTSDDGEEEDAPPAPAATSHDKPDAYERMSSPERPEMGHVSPGSPPREAEGPLHQASADDSELWFPGISDSSPRQDHGGDEDVTTAMAEEAPRPKWADMFSSDPNELARVDPLVCRYRHILEEEKRVKDYDTQLAELEASRRQAEYTGTVKAKAETDKIIFDQRIYMGLIQRSGRLERMRRDYDHARLRYGDAANRRPNECIPGKERDVTDFFIQRIDVESANVRMILPQYSGENAASDSLRIDVVHDEDLLFIKQRDDLWYALLRAMQAEERRG